MRIILLLIFSWLTLTSLTAQLNDGAIAPDFSGTDLDGVEHNLYDLLAEGKTVVLDVSATWCGPCWSYHNMGILKEFMSTYGPDGTDEAMVFMIEDDISTTLDDLKGTGTNTTGDWITGTNYPIIDSQNGIFNTQYQVSYFPTLYIICPDRIITEIGQAQLAGFESALGNCPQVNHAPEPAFLADVFSGCESLDVKFEDDSWPPAQTWRWDFGDGNTSEEQFPSNRYQSPGDYDVSLTVTNAFGETKKTVPAAITVGTGYVSSNQRTGLASNNEPGGTGRYFEGGHQGMLFDALSDFVLASATAYSDRPAMRTFVITDANDNLIAKREIFIDEGEHRVELNMTIPQGTDYRFGMWSEAYLYRNDSGVNYPYIVDNIVNIKTSTVTNTNVNPDDYYYYLYDWKVRDIGCNASVSSVSDFDLMDLTVYPNPAMDRIVVEGQNITDHDIQLRNVSGLKMKVDMRLKQDAAILDISQLETGLYLISVGDRTMKVYKQ